MRERIVFESKTRTTDNMGGSSVSWSTHATVWGSVKEVSGTENYETLQITAERTTVFSIRYLSTITESMRINWNSGYYDIVQIINEDDSVMFGRTRTSGARDKFLHIRAVRNGAV